MKSEITPYTYDEFIEIIAGFQKKCLDTIIAKNAGYSPYKNPYTNFMSQRDILEPIFGGRYPLISMDARSGDKKSRKQNFITNGLPKDKDYLDDFFDAANYSLIEASYWECLRRSDPKSIYGRIKSGV